MPKVRRKTTIKRRKSRTDKSMELQDHTRRQLRAIIFVGVGIVLLLALQDSAGSLGGAIGRGLKVLFGNWSMLFPMFLIVLGTLLLFASGPKMERKRTWGPALSLFAFLGLVHLNTPVTGTIANELDTVAGAVGFMAAFPFITFLSVQVGYVVLSMAFIAGLFITFEPNIPALLRQLRPEETGKKVVRQRETEPEDVQMDTDDLIERGAKLDQQEEDEDEPVIPDLNIVRPAFAERKIEEDAPKKPIAKAKPNGMIEMKDTRFEEWKFPELELLEGKHSELTVKDEDLKSQAVLIQQKLSEFDIAVTMKDAHPGPTVTQFTLQPSEGVKLSKIESLKDDLALALAAQSLRIEAPIPGKALVGIEMPNAIRSTVYLRELLESTSFRQSDSPLTIPLGRGVSGDAVVATIEDMPHLLIAGATGAGKSVCMNTFLISLLFQNAPHELKFILIDPKRVELMPYNGIPHLLTPVITESDKALQAL
ncbi:MAG TPA: DNA translocase FtsK, partial [Candidatus Peribacteria bacterium]|nr:DNA translocase FtsK [Candidatus Peribacteria bacterium]